jgi:hypothetical protein
MKTRILHSFCPLSGFVLCLYAGNIASAQEASNGSASARSGSSIPHTAGKGTAAKDVLDNPRLRFRVTIERSTTNVEQALTKLCEYTPLHLEAQGAELRFTAIVFHYKATPLRDILASIAETGDWEWIRKNENTLVLKESYNPHALDLYHPHNEAEKEVHDRGVAFLDQFGKLPPDMQAALSMKQPLTPGSLTGLPFTSLPSAVQDNLRAMFAAHTAATAASGGKLPLTSNDLSHCTVVLDSRTPQEGFNPFDVDLGADLPNGDRAGISMSFVEFQDPRDGYNVVPMNEVTGVDHKTVEKDALSRQKALATNPHLQEKVSLKLENASLFQALKALSTKVDLAFSEQYLPEKGKQAQRSFSLPTMPLGEMLDKLSTLYGGKDGEGRRYRYTWGQQGNQASQVFVFHISLEPNQTGE